MSEYRPGNVPSSPADIPAFLEQELRAIAAANAQPSMQLLLSVRHMPPPRLADGVVVLADGVDWNPGSGPGFYGYRAGSWRFLG